jgi:hypothetical protein
MDKEQIVNPLEKALADILTKTTAGIEKGVEFLNAELPEVINQLLIWKAAEALVFMIIFVCVGCGLLLLSKYMSKYAKQNVDDWTEEDRAFYGAMQWAVCIIGIVVTIAAILSNREWLQIWLAPKIYLIEYAAQLLK